MEKQRVFITVKTYPTLSRKYGETVCTAGVREDGTCAASRSSGGTGRDRCQPGTKALLGAFLDATLGLEP